MLPSLNLESVFTDAITRHLLVVRQLEFQQPRLEKIATCMTQALLDG